VSTSGSVTAGSSSSAATRAMRSQSPLSTRSKSSASVFLREAHGTVALERQSQAARPGRAGARGPAAHGSGHLPQRNEGRDSRAAHRGAEAERPAGQAGGVGSRTRQAGRRARGPDQRGPRRYPDRLAVEAVKAFVLSLWNDEARFIGVMRGLIVVVAGLVRQGVIPTGVE